WRRRSRYRCRIGDGPSTRQYASRGCSEVVWRPDRPVGARWLLAEDGQPLGGLGAGGRALGPGRAAPPPEPAPAASRRAAPRAAWSYTPRAETLRWLSRRFFAIVAV